MRGEPAIEIPEIPEIQGIIAYQRKQYAVAVPLFQESERKRPLNAKALFYMGMSLAQTKKGDQARPALEKALAASLPEPFAGDARRALNELGPR